MITAFNQKQELSLPVEGAFEDYALRIVAQICHQRPPDILALSRIFSELDAISESWLERNIRIATAFRDRLLNFM